MHITIWLYNKVHDEGVINKSTGEITNKDTNNNNNNTRHRTQETQGFDAWTENENR